MDYFLPSDEQLLGLTGTSSLEETARELLKRGVGCVAATRGPQGALVVSEDEVMDVPAFAVEVVDTTGCGDAFSEGFLREPSLGKSLRDAAEFGTATAAHVAQGVGTDDGDHDLVVLERFVASY